MMTRSPLYTTRYDYTVVQTDLGSTAAVIRTARLVEIADLVSAKALAPLLNNGCEISVCVDQEFRHLVPVGPTRAISAVATYRGENGRGYQFEVVISDEHGQVFWSSLTRTITCQENLFNTTRLRLFKDDAERALSHHWPMTRPPNTKQHLQLMRGEPEIPISRPLRREKDFTGPLHHALAHGSELLIESFFQSNVNIHSADFDGWNPLHFAARHSTARVVSRLIGLGANVDTTTRHNESPLFLAWQSRNIDIFNVLLEGGANLGRLVPNFLVPGIGEPCRGAMHLAAHYGDRALMSLLLDAGLDINKEILNGWTPLMAAVDKGMSPGFIELMLEKGAAINARDRESQTALQLANDGGHVALVGILRRHGGTGI
ncbi:restless-like transposase [Purpureocillium lavendulum]|uniref:Restless-like transposase n=1 Tax=Purpureocillium lavendulum TaxID=1247861 RepID=A0AB34FID4_9HYPO|nr:restless-like transposase [Purpureocillium lavendulum]